MDFLPGHGFEIDVVTLPDDWMRFQGQDHLSGASLPAIQPEARTDNFVRQFSQIRYLNWLQRAILLPDLLAPWARAAARKAAPKLEGVDVVYGTSPPYSGMILASRLADELGVPCVQELRDPPSFHRALRRRSDFYRRRMVGFERRYLSRASQVIAVTPGTRTRLLELHPNLDPARIHVVTNGYPDVDIDPGKSGRDPEKFTVTYVGTFQGSVRARKSSVFTPAILMEALNQLPADKVSLRIVGKTSTQQRQNLAALDPNGIVEFVGMVERSAALAEVATADIAVILADDDPWWIGRKAFEYLRFAHTILAVVPDGDTTDLLKSHSRVDVVSPDDPKPLVPVLKRRFAEWSSGNWVRGPVPERIQTDESCVAGIAQVLRTAVSA